MGCCTVHLSFNRFACTKAQPLFKLFYKSRIAELRCVALSKQIEEFFHFRLGGKQHNANTIACTRSFKRLQFTFGHRFAVEQTARALPGG